MREPNQALTLVALEPALGSPKRNALVMCQTLQGHTLFELWGGKTSRWVDQRCLRHA